MLQRSASALLASSTLRDLPRPAAADLVPRRPHSRAALNAASGSERLLPLRRRPHPRNTAPPPPPPPPLHNADGTSALLTSSTLGDEHCPSSPRPLPLSSPQPPPLHNADCSNTDGRNGATSPQGAAGHADGPGLGLGALLDESETKSATAPRGLGHAEHAPPKRQHDRGRNDTVQGTPPRRALEHLDRSQQSRGAAAERGAPEAAKEPKRRALHHPSSAQLGSPRGSHLLDGSAHRASAPCSKSASAGRLRARRRRSVRRAVEEVRATRRAELRAARVVQRAALRLLGRLRRAALRRRAARLLRAVEVLQSAARRRALDRVIAASVVLPFGRRVLGVAEASRRRCALRLTLVEEGAEAEARTVRVPRCALRRRRAVAAVRVGAVGVVQRWWLRRAERERARRRRAVLVAERTAREERARAVGVVQRWWWRWWWRRVARMRASAERQKALRAARSIQCCARVWAARDEVGRRRARKVAERAAREQRARATLQHWWRGGVVGRAVAKSELAARRRAYRNARRIQRCARAWVARGRVRHRRAELTVALLLEAERGLRRGRVRSVRPCEDMRFRTQAFVRMLREGCGAAGGSGAGSCKPLASCSTVAADGRRARRLLLRARAARFL